MDPQQLTIMAHKFQAVFDADVLNDRGSQLALQASASTDAFRFGLSVIASMATKTNPEHCSLYNRDFNALWDVESTYKALL